MLSLMRSQAARYGAAIRSGRIEHLHRQGEVFVASLDGHDIRARHVILATGVEDTASVPDFRAAVTRGLVRLCPICDAYEVIGRAVAVIGAGDQGAREAVFLRHYSGDVTLLHIGAAADLDEAARRELASAGISLIETELASLAVQTDRLDLLGRGAGRRSFSVVYSALGMQPRVQLAVALGAATNAAGFVVTDDHQRTSVEGLYAAGDVVRGLNQISIAEAEAAIAATDVHNRLRDVV